MRVQAGASAPRPRNEEKVADKPHPITIRIGIFAPSIALVALFVSFASLWTSQQSMRIGQRAYLSIQEVKVTASSPENRRIWLSISNTGNTPAIITDLRSHCEIANQTMECMSSVSGNTPGSIGAKSSFADFGSIYVFVPLPKKPHVTISAFVVITLSYKDVFNSKHEEHYFRGLTLP